MIDPNNIFNISSPTEFEHMAMELFRFQYQKNTTYRTFCGHLGKTDKTVSRLDQIPFLPIELFKTQRIVTGNLNTKTVFTSSGTTGQIASQHHIYDVEIYKRSYLSAFEHFYGDIGNYCILALLPSYLERSGSSLVYMVDDLIKRSGNSNSGFYLDEIDLLIETLEKVDGEGGKVLLIGVSFALLDLIEKQQLQLNRTIVMETGGMKGRRKELIRSELHDTLQNGFGITEIHSEYGMTELLSQAYSKGHGKFYSPPWMHVLIRDPEDPLSYLGHGKTGGINVIDLANIHSCSFIATQDLGKKFANGSFEVLGRFDHSDIRGCNLMVF